MSEDKTVIEKFFVLTTASVREKVHPLTVAKMIKIAIEKMKPEGPDFISFSKNADKEALDDGGLTLRVPMPDLPEDNVYAVLENHGTAKAASSDIGQKIDSPYVIVLCFPSER